MKKIITILFLMLSISLSAQNDGFNYKALLADGGEALSETNVSIRFSIIQQSSTVYTETIQTTTDKNGVLSVVIGSNSTGTEFEDIRWSKETLLKVEINTGNGFTDFGTNPFHYVPYAMYAESGGSVKSLNDLSDARVSSPYGSIFIGENSGNNEHIYCCGNTNVGIGPHVLEDLVKGFDNVALGAHSSQHNNGTGNISIGNLSLNSARNAGANIAIGSSSLRKNNGNKNVAIGFTAGASNEIGNGNIFIGYSAGSSEVGSDKLYIDNSGTNKPLIYGEFDNDLIEINGKLKVVDGTQEMGKVLTSDAEGLASWQTPATVSNLWNSDGDNIYRIAGKVGIGTTKPLEALHIHDGIIRLDYKDRHNGIKIIAKNAETTQISTSGNDLRIDSWSGGHILFGTLVSNGASGLKLRICNGDDGPILVYSRLLLEKEIQIKGGTPGLGKVLTSDATGLASWKNIPNKSKWKSNGETAYRSGNVGIGLSTPLAPLHIKSGNTASIILESSVSNIRPGIQFINNTSHYISGDDKSNETFGFYSTWSSNRNYNAKLRVYGKARGSWGKYIEFTHDGTDATIKTDAGNLTIAPAGKEVIIDGKITTPSTGNNDLKAYAYGTIDANGSTV